MPMTRSRGKRRSREGSCTSIRRTLLVALTTAAALSGCVHSESDAVERALEVTSELDDRFPDHRGEVPCRLRSAGPSIYTIPGTCETAVKERGDDVVVRHIERWTIKDRLHDCTSVYIVSREGEIVNRAHYGDDPPEATR